MWILAEGEREAENSCSFQVGGRPAFLPSFLLSFFPSFQAKSHYVAQAGPKVMGLLPQPPKS